jgi:hypothetical protein
VDYSYANVIDTFTLKAMHGEQDGTIRTRQDLDRLLEKARRYWVDDWATEPVWIEARGSEETNTRYATIKNWALPADDNPYAQPFFPQQEEAVMDDLVLTLEHDFWQAVSPGSSSTVEAAAQQVYNGTTYGQEATTDLEVYIANKYNEANLTHIFTWTSPGGPFSGNLIGAATPFDIFTGGAAGPANADITYFGINTALADSGPFTNMVFDILTAATYGAGDSVTWQYWNGAWVALTVHDGTDPAGAGQPFTETGVNSINWIPPSDWATAAVNAITGYWVRFVVTEATGIGRAQQQNRDVYSAIWPRCDVDDAQVAGDLPSLMQLTIEGQSDAASGVDLDATINRIIVGLRSTDRDGTDAFEAFLPFSDEQIPPTWTAVDATARTADVNDIEAPSGRAIQYTGVGVIAMTTELYLQADRPTPESYVGEFHAFLRYQVSAGSDGDLRARVQFTPELTATNLIYQTETFDLLAESDWVAADLGRVFLPPGGSTDIPDTLFIIVQIQGISAAARNATFYDIVLIPVDEWMGDYQENVTASSAGAAPLGENAFLQIDAVAIPKRKRAAPVRFHPLAAPALFPIRNRFLAYTAGPPILQANEDQKLWFLMMRSDSLTNLPRYSDPWLLGRLQIVNAERYQSMRGSR